MGAVNAIWEGLKTAGKAVLDFLKSEGTKKAVKEGAKFAAKEVGKAAITAGAAKAVDSMTSDNKDTTSFEANKSETAEDLAKQRERERVRALSATGLLGGNSSVLGGWGEGASPSSRSSLLGN